MEDWGMKIKNKKTKCIVLGEAVENIMVKIGKQQNQWGN